MGSDLAAQCVMVRVKDQPDHFLVHEWGLFFDEVTASSLIKIRMDGKMYNPKTSKYEECNPSTVNMGCVPVAQAIFGTYPDRNCILHIHPLAVMAVGGLTKGLQPISQAAFFLHNQHTTYKYNFGYESDFEADIANCFNNGKRVIILEHHGMYAIGSTVAEAFFVAFYTNQACEVQCRTLSMGVLGGVKYPDIKALDKQVEDMMKSPDYSYDGSREWSGLIREANRKSSDYNI